MRLLVLVLFVVFTINLHATIYIPESLQLLKDCKSLQAEIEKFKSLDEVTVEVDRKRFLTLVERFHEIQSRFFLLDGPEHFIDKEMKKEKPRQKELEQILGQISKLLREKYRKEVLGDPGK